jgi:hypothetical protein
LEDPAVVGQFCTTSPIPPVLSLDVLDVTLSIEKWNQLELMGNEKSHRTFITENYY